MLKRIVQAAAPGLVTESVTAAMRTTEPGSLWHKRLQEDRHGMYAELREVEEAATWRPQITMNSLPGEEIFNRPWQLMEVVPQRVGDCCDSSLTSRKSSKSSVASGLGTVRAANLAGRGLAEQGRINFMLGRVLLQVSEADLGPFHCGKLPRLVAAFGRCCYRFLKVWLRPQYFICCGVVIIGACHIISH